MQPITKTRILAFLAEEDRLRHAREIASALKVKESGYLGLVRMLDDLALEGQIANRGGQRYKLSKATAQAKGEEIEGWLSMTPRGAGFVATGANDDVFIPPEAIAGAMHGDRVKARVVARGSRGRQGEIAGVLERGIKRVAGILRRRGKSAWLEPDDSRLRGPITLLAGPDLRGPEGNSGKDGDAAVVTITTYPMLIGENPEGRLEAVLGMPGELSVEVAKVLVREQIEELHSPQATDEATAYGESVPESMLVGREDLTHLPLPTIDPEDARDHDDAVWVERASDGGYRAYIAIADVSSYVTPNTALDEEAKARGCSVYLPDRAVPMLPRALSSNLCSLLPGVIRLCLCAIVDIDSGGNVRSEKLVRGFMKSRAKLTYGGVARTLGLSALPPRDPMAEEMLDGLRVAHELSRILRGKRMKRGSLDFELPEAKIVLGEDGLPKDIARRAEDPGVKKAYQLIEELMLLANETVARWLASKKVPTIYRVHAPPDEEKLARFMNMCDELGIAVEMDTLQNPKRLSLFLQGVSKHQAAPVLNMLLLRSMKQAAYDTVNVGHFGLASTAYLHFTSPIRRYPDLAVHRSVHSILLNEKIDRSPVAETKLAEAALRSSQNERRVMDAEREVADIYRVFFMRDKVGGRYEGTVTALVGTGLYVALDSPFVDVLVRYEDLSNGDRWELDDSGLRAVAQRSGATVKLGDRIAVEVTDVAILRRTVYAKRILAEGEAERPPRHDKRGKNVRHTGKTARTREAAARHDRRPKGKKHKRR